MTKVIIGTWKSFIAKAVSLGIIVVLLVVFSGWAQKMAAADAATQERIDAAERAASRGPFNVADGTYEGTAVGYGGDVTVAVTVSNGYIETVEPVSYEHEDAAWWVLAKSLFDTIPAEQSTDVDVVSTATYSSAGIINATKAALLSAPEAGE